MTSVIPLYLSLYRNQREHLHPVTTTAQATPTTTTILE